VPGFAQAWILIPVRAVVAEPRPIHYLVLIGLAEILPALFEKLIVPSVVHDELSRAEAPDTVRAWV
jgi:predicted nucleic acid-binding protein